MKCTLRKMSGYLYGSVQPAIAISVEKEPLTDNKRRDGLAECAVLFSNMCEMPERPLFDNVGAATPNEFLTHLVESLCALNTHCGDQRFTPIKYLDEENYETYIVPTVSPDLAALNFSSLTTFLKKHKDHLTLEAVKGFVNTLRAKNRVFLPLGTNAMNFIFAAIARKIPFKILSNRHIIFGYGSSSVIFMSSVTSRENAVGVDLADSKLLTKTLLGLAELPVAKGFGIDSIDSAVKRASEIGYPVVLKPVCGRQGRGVIPGIASEDALRTAYSRVRATGENKLLIEKHISGECHRITVLNGKIINAFEMQSARVVGDGKSSVSDLIEQENLRPSRNVAISSMCKIIVDNDVMDILKQQGIELATVPEQGDTVFLAFVSNESRGGMYYECTARLHPENARLCIAVAETMNLSLSGIDFISEDASKPWFENNAMICEVNAQPQLGEFGEDSEIFFAVLDSAQPMAVPINLTISNDETHQSSGLFNKTLNAIDLYLTPAEVFRNGCPAQYFTTLTIAENVPISVRRSLIDALVSIEPL